MGMSILHLHRQKHKWMVVVVVGGAGVVMMNCGDGELQCICI